MNRFTLRAVRTFVTVAECGTISAAAERLGRSQGSVSTTVSDFEEQVGLQLFVRKPAKGLALTPSGELVALEARGLLAHADEFETIAGALGNAVEGDLTVGCFTNLAPVVFANIMGSFSARYPSIRIHIEIGDQEEILQGLKSGRIETRSPSISDCPTSSRRSTWPSFRHSWFCRSTIGSRAGGPCGWRTSRPSP
jgi:DNA-binding transcriptional LysR family regulator